MNVSRSLFGSALSNHALKHDERRLVLAFFGFGDKLDDFLNVVHAALKNLPAIGFIALGDVFVKGDVGASVNADFVLVVEHDELSKLKVAGQAAGLA